jgi:hypothetical protein
MTLSTLHPPLPALEGLIVLTPRPPQPISPKTTTKKNLGLRLSRDIRRDILVLRERIALGKPPISEKNRLERLAWAHEHVHWTETC